MAQITLGAKDDCRLARAATTEIMAMQTIEELDRAIKLVNQIILLAECKRKKIEAYIKIQKMNSEAYDS